jgi:hypothetical protein
MGEGREEGFGEMNRRLPTAISGPMKKISDLKTEIQIQLSRGPKWYFCPMSLGIYLPLLFPDFFLGGFLFPYYYYPIFRVLLLLVPMAAACFCFSNRRDYSLAGFARIAFLASVGLGLEYIHHQNIDLNFHYFFFFPRENMVWQHEVHSTILKLRPWEIPHVYRFLPNCIVAILDVFANNFQYAKEIYRGSAMILLVYAIYCFSRAFVSELGSLLCVLGYALIYPVSIRYYNGQLIDPLSHLSFICTYIFIRDKKAGWLAFTIFHGAMAKESILAMAVFNIFQRRKEPSALVVASGTFVFTLLPVILVRLYVNYGHLSYLVISGVPPHWYLGNLVSNAWVPQTIRCIGIFLPFFFIRLRWLDPFLRNLILFIVPVLFLSNLMFSWLYEVRNYVPAAIPLIIVTVQFWEWLSQFLARKWQQRKTQALV